MCAARTTLGYWVGSAGVGGLQPIELPSPRAGEVELRALFSGISPGTERLVGRGLVAASCSAAMACRGMQGSFALPILYGYSLVGTVQGEGGTPRRAFVMRPHQQSAIVPVTELVFLPDDVPSARATLLPNLETALNASWDAESAGTERIAVVGAGAVGLLVAFVLSTRRGGDVVVVDADPERRALAQQLPWVANVLAPENLPTGEFAIAFHATGTGQGLQLAIDAIGFEGRVVELSWYGSQAISVQLGGSFHYQRKRILASQVGTIAASHRAAGHTARTSAVLELLADSQLDALLQEPVPFTQLPDAFARIYRGETTPPCPLVAY